jgi:hypothetical protein
MNTGEGPIQYRPLFLRGLCNEIYVAAGTALRSIEAQEPCEGGKCRVRNVVLDTLSIEFG